MDNNGTIHERITQLVDAYGKGKNTVFASLIGSNEANVRGYRTNVMPKFDFLEKIARSLDIDLKWLLTGEGSMFSDSKNTEEATMDHGTEKVQSMPSDAVALRLMEKLDEKDTKIDQLQAELRRQSEELAAIKALHSQSQNKESDHHTKISEVIENFTSDSSGDYGEGYPLTKKPTSSKRSSAGKM